MSAEYKICLQQNVRVVGLEASTDLRWEVDNILGNWSDGRYPFDVEQIRRGLVNVVEAAVYRAIEVAARKQFGDEMVKTSPSSETARWHLETEKILKNLSVHPVSDSRCSSASTVDADLELDGESTKWRVLCRDDRKADGAPGDYALSSRVFDDADAARAHAIGISSSRFPIVVEASKADAVLGALNFKADRWGK